MRVYVVVYAMEFDDRTMDVVQSVHATAEGALAEVKRISLHPDWHNIEHPFATQESADTLLADLKAGKQVAARLRSGGSSDYDLVGARAFEVQDP